MIDLRLGRYALGVCAATAMLAGCGGQGSNGVMPTGVPDSSLLHHKTFNYTGGAQDFTVPAGVTHISVVARGAHGGGSPKSNGGRVHAVLPVTPGEKLVVYVGGDGLGTTGGFNGGGSGGSTSSGGGKGGGGATDVREGGTSLGDRIIVSGAGGGGGGGGSSYVESRAKNVHMWQGWNNPERNGLVVISW